MSNEKRATKKMSRFNLANSVKGLVKAGLLVNKKSAIIRAFASAIDTVEDKIQEISLSIDEARTSLYKTDRSSDKSAFIKSLIDLKFENEDCEKALKFLREEEAAMNEKVSVVSSNEDEDEDEDLKS